MNEDDKIDLIAAILAAGSAAKTGQIVGNFRAIRSQLRSEVWMSQRGRPADHRSL